MPFSLTRRQFGFTVAGSALSALPAAPSMGPAIVKKLYLAIEKPTWPRPDIDVKQQRAEIESNLAVVERRHSGRVRLTGGELLRTPEMVQAWTKDLGDADAILLFDLTSGNNTMLRALSAADVPILCFSRPYSGWAYVDFTAWAQSGRKADILTTSDYGDLDPYMRIFGTIHHLRKSKVLVVRSDTGFTKISDGFTKQFGTAFQHVTFQELKAAFDAADAGKAERAAAEFTRGALRVLEPSAGDVRDALRFYLAVEQVLERENANAITIDCLGGFRRGELPAYPCVAWSKLNDRGLYGVCEADLYSTMTQLLLSSYSGKAGFVSDPVFDTSRNEIIHAHCVAATALQGAGGPRCRYIVRSHMEDNRGVSMQVLMPPTGKVTVGKFADARKFLISTAEVAGNIDDKRGCRTKIRTRVSNARKMLEGYSAGLHRVVFYGDYVRAVEQMGRLMGFGVVKEM